MARKRPTERQRKAAYSYVVGRLAANPREDRARLWKDVELTEELAWRPGRSTVYAWAKEWREARGRDDTGTWTLATDDTRHPEVVMGVLGALVQFNYDGRLTNAEARWAVRLALALPAIVQPTAEVKVGTAVGFGPLSLISWAQRYVDAEGDAERMAQLDAEVAALYTPDLIAAMSDALDRRDAERRAHKAQETELTEWFRQGEKEQDNAR